MKLLSKFNFSKSFVFLAGIAALLTASCSSMMSKPEPLSETEACKRLTGIIADHPNKFNKHKKDKRIIDFLNTWTAIEPFPTAKNCKVWEWSTGLNSYTCSWISDNGKDGAKAGYEEGKAIISRCLGKQWSAGNNPTSTGGKHTYFYQNNSKTYVSIRYFKEQRSIMENWHTVLYIGDKSNLKAKTQ